MLTASRLGTGKLQVFVLRIKNGGVGKKYMAPDDLTDLRVRVDEKQNIPVHGTTVLSHQHVYNGGLCSSDGWSCMVLDPCNGQELVLALKAFLT